VPSTSEKQAKLMAAVAHNPAFAKKVGIPQSVGEEFNKADKGRKFGRGGDMGKKVPSEGKKAKMGSMQKIAARAVKSHEKRMHSKKMSSGGSCRGGGAATKGTSFKGVM
jgi:hypothetical protein